MIRRALCLLLGHTFTIKRVDHDLTVPLVLRCSRCKTQFKFTA